MRALRRRLFANAGALLSGTVVAAVLAVCSTAVTARALGPSQFGILVLIQTFAAVVDRLSSFQSWQVLIKYGAELLENDSESDFAGLVKFGFGLDIVAACVGGCVGVLLVQVIGQWREWHPAIVSMASVYLAVVFTNATGTATGVLRLFDRYALASLHKAAVALLKLAACTAAYVAGASLRGFVLAWLVTAVAGQLSLIWAALWTLRSNGHQNILSADWRKVVKKHQGIWGFAWTSNLNSSIRTASKEADTIIVGALTGSVGAGLYKVVKQFGSILALAVDPLYHAIYPDLARLWARRDFQQFLGLMARAAMAVAWVAVLFWLIIVGFGHDLIVILVGDEYLSAHVAMIWYVGAMVVAVTGFPLQPAMLAMGLPRLSFRAGIIATVVYFVALFALGQTHGLPGAAAAYVIYYLVWSVLMLLPVLQQYTSAVQLADRKHTIDSNIG